MRKSNQPCPFCGDKITGARSIHLRDCEYTNSSAGTEHIKSMYRELIETLDKTNDEC